MKEAFVQYLKKIGITEPLQERIESIYTYFEEVCPEEITDIFVSEYITEDGSRIYEDLRFLSKRYGMRAIDFINKDDFNMGEIVNAIEVFKLERKDYDFKNSNEKSRMKLTLRYVGNTISPFKASKENCDYLRDIIHKYVIPNLRKY